MPNYRKLPNCSDFGFPRDFFMEVKKSALLLRLAVEDLDGVLKDKQISVFS